MIRPSCIFKYLCGVGASQMKDIHYYIFTLTWIFFLCDPGCLYGQSDTIRMAPVEISGKRMPQIYPESSRMVIIISGEEIRKAPVGNLHQLLGYVLSADVRQRGPEGVQADISVRGGSFEQTLILLNGIRMNDPQTGHHSMNLPVHLNDIERIEVLEGPGLWIYGDQAFSGAVNIITRSGKGKSLNCSVMAGQHGLTSVYTAGSADFAGIQNTLSLSKEESEGYIRNTDFKNCHLYYIGSKQTPKLKAVLEAGFLNKQFGANSFYSAKYPDQYEQTRTFFSHAGISGGKKWRYSLQGFYKSHKDKFELFRYDVPAWYAGPNYHLTRTLGVNADFNAYSFLGKTTAAVELRNEKIYSNVLGALMPDLIRVAGEEGAFYNRSGSRQVLNLFLGHYFSFKRIVVSGGAGFSKSSGFSLRFYGGGDFSFMISHSVRIFTSVNRSLRNPTFTDLYYSGPQNKGNPQLKPEESITYEAGLKLNRRLVHGGLCYFVRQSDNIIDWIREPGAEIWESSNLTSITTHGVELYTDINVGGLKSQYLPLDQISVSCSFLFSNKKSTPYISYYVMDYLKNKFSLLASHRIYKNLKASWGISLFHRAGSYTDFLSGKEVPYKTVLTIDCKLSYEHGPLYLYAQISNITDNQFIDIGNMKQPGRWARVGMAFHFNALQLRGE